MSIEKAIKILLKFKEENKDKPFDYLDFWDDFNNYLSSKIKSKKVIKNIQLKLEIAQLKDFIMFSDDAETDIYGYAILLTPEFAEYMLENERSNKKIFWGALGSLFTLIGTIIGALIATFV